MAIQIQGAVFLHIPKTGGTFITHYFRETNMVVRELTPEHMNAVKFREIVPETEDLIFCFVRHPLSWYRSYWQHRQSLPNNRSGGPIDSYVDQPFHDFVRDIVTNFPGYLTDFTNTYVNRCRAIGRQENLVEDLDKILHLLKIPYNRNFLYSKREVNRSHSEEKFTQGLTQMVMDSEAGMIERYYLKTIPREMAKELIADV